MIFPRFKTPGFDLKSGAIARKAISDNQNRKFQNELEKIRSDFNDYTVDVRTKSVRFCLAMLAVNWAIYGKPLDNGATLYHAIVGRPLAKWSILSAIAGLFVTVVYSYCYAVHLKIWDHIIQKDFCNDRVLFDRRDDFKSHYPYHQMVGRVALGIDGLVLFLCGLSALTLWLSVLQE